MYACEIDEELTGAHSLAVACADHKIRIFQTGEQTQLLQGHSTYVNDVAFGRSSGASNMVASVSGKHSRANGTVWQPF
jgi:hypothetical protein